MYLLFLWRLYLMVLRCATSLLGALEGVGHFRAQKSLNFQGPLLPMPLVMILFLVSVWQREVLPELVNRVWGSGFRIRIRTGSGFNQVSGSRIRIRIQIGKNDPKK